MALGTSKGCADSDGRRTVRLDSLAHRSHGAAPCRGAHGSFSRVPMGWTARSSRWLRMSQTTVCKWRGRFVRERLDGLYDEPRPGTPGQNQR